jgi:hypothetical protein
MAMMPSGIHFDSTAPDISRPFLCVPRTKIECISYPGIAASEAESIQVNLQISLNKRVNGHCQVLSRYGPFASIWPIRGENRVLVLVAQL